MIAHSRTVPAPTVARTDALTAAVKQKTKNMMGKPAAKPLWTELKAIVEEVEGLGVGLEKGRLKSMIKVK